MFQPGLLFASEGNHPTALIKRTTLLPDPTYEGSPGSSSAKMRKVQAVSWGCHSARSTLLSISSKGEPPLAHEVFALCDAACCSCLLSVPCSDLCLAGNVCEGMPVTSQTGPLREGSQTLVASWKKDDSVGLPLNAVYTALLRTISGFYLNIPRAVEVHLQEIK